ncbi:uncharacterized protein Dmoj_GI23106 [Drosophila mojavensis]|uniref:Gustatory receptor n=2 Tax=Drosophila mojavensis TaxID=7230 RepID=B4KCK5_DROMO|nr:uncharacterized protein Dmoj_GI23106 [Drosophila mojavensis]
MALLLAVYPYIRWLGFVSCVYCAQRWQQRIFNMLQALLKVERFIAESHYCVTPLEKSHLQLLFWLRLLLQVPRTVAFIIYAFTAVDGLYIFVGALGSKTIVDELYFLTFTIIWQMCYTLMKLQRYINQLYASPIPRKSKKEQKMLEVHRMYYRLIQMTRDYCEVFKYPLACMLLILVCMSCVTGCSYYRLLVGNHSDNSKPLGEWITLLVNINYFLELYLFALIASMIGRIHEYTLHELRASLCDSDLVERSSDWLGLQLAFQDTSIKIFGLFKINLQLFIPLVSGIALHIIYIIQCDYNYM